MDNSKSSAKEPELNHKTASGAQDKLKEIDKEMAVKLRQLKDMMDQGGLSESFG